MNTGDILQGRYRIVRLVGQGGFGAVYRAWDLSLSQPVALKENMDGGIESQRQFEREAKLLAGLRHPNLPRVGDHFIIPGQGQYLVMDFIEGKSLAALLAERGRPFTEAEVLPWIQQVCSALDYLHSRKPPIIHRDIKPDNIIITTTSGGATTSGGGATADGRAILVDFGISKEFDPGKGTTLSAKAVTPGYSPPEQYASGKTDNRSDVYALGATLYTLLTGQVPPEGPSLSSGVATLVPPRRANPAVSEKVSAAIQAAMTPNISKRLNSASQLAEQLAGGPRASASVAGGAPVVAAPPAPRRRRHPWRWLLVFVLLLALAGGAAWVLMGQPNPMDVLRGGAEPTALVADTPPEGTTTPTPDAITATAASGVVTSADTTAAPNAPTKTVMPDEPAVTTDDTAATEPTTAVPTVAVPTATTELTPLSVPAAPSGPLRINQPWEQDGVSLTARSIEIYAQNNGNDAAARVWYRLVNKTTQRLFVDIDWTYLHLEDSAGTQYIDWDPGTPTSVWVEAGENYDFDRYYGIAPTARSRVPAETTFVQVVAKQFSRVTDARWQADINPPLQAMGEPAEGTTRQLNETWEQDGLAIRLTGLEVPSETDGSDYAARAWFEVTNLTNQERLVEIDFGRIAVIDSYGRRFGDWDGGGLYSRNVAAGDTLTFDRYYSERSGTRSRVTRGSRFVLVQAQGVGPIADARWTVPLNFRLSAGDIAPGSTSLRINQPWEQAGVALTARALTIYAEDNGNDAAARTWFRLTNKTSQWLLVPIDWNNIHLVDGQGTTYDDWEGGQTSVWVEPGGVWDFDRYYSVTPKTRSRIPSAAGYVQVVVDRLSNVAGARWQYDVNPQLQPIAAPAEGATLPVGEAWEQDGLSIRLTGLEALAESDGSDYAARAWFELTNTANQTLIVEVDFGRIAVIDSYGRRFGDWDGGGLYARVLAPGDTMTFDRYYSEMSGSRSRITRGSEWVVLTLDNVAGFANAAWRLDIVR